MDLRLGNLLSQFDLLEETEVEKALGVATETGLPVGKVLVMLERISNPTLKAVLEAQWMLKDDLLTMTQAKAAMDLVKRNGWNFSDALVAIEVDAYATKGARLGELLVASGQMVEDDVDTFLKVSNQSLLPLGRVLILLERMHEPGLDTALKLQREIRLGHIDAGEGAIRLRSALEQACQAASEQLTFSGQNSNSNSKSIADEIAAEKKANQAPIKNMENMKLGELLVAAGLISEKEVDIALDIAIANNKMIGEVLTEHSWIDEDVLDQALNMQTEARNKRMSYHDVVERLRSQVTTGTFPAQEPVVSSAPTAFERNLTLYEFLRLTGYMTPNKLSNVITTVSQKPKILAEIASSPNQGLKQAIKQAVQDSSRFSTLLIKTMPEERDVVTAAHNLQKQVNSGALKLDRSILEFTLLRSSHRLATGA